MSCLLMTLEDGPWLYWLVFWVATSVAMLSLVGFGYVLGADYGAARMLRESMEARGGQHGTRAR